MAESQFLINHCGMTPLSLTMSKHEGDGFSIVKAVGVPASLGIVKATLCKG